MQLSRLLVAAVLVSMCGIATAQDSTKMRKVADYCVLWKTGTASEADMAKAEKLADKSLQRIPADWGALFCKVNIFAGRKDWKGFVETAKRLEAIAGNEFEQYAAYSYLSTGYFSLGMNEESLRYREKAQPLEKVILGK